MLFRSKKELNIFGIVKKHISKYKSAPVKDELLTEVQTIQMTDKDVEDCQEIVSELFDIETSDEQWLLEKTEKWCQEKSVYNAVMESISIIDGTVDKNKNTIPDILKQALAVSFKIELGHDYIEDADARFEYYNKKDEKKIPFGIDLFNKVTRGGIASKTLNVVMAGCVHPKTKIKVRLKLEEWIEKEVSIGEIQDLIEDYEIEVDSPDGWVPVTLFVDKGEYEEYVLTTENSSVSCNEHHLFETQNGWEFAKDLIGVEDRKFLSDTGEYVSGKVEKTGEIVPIVDINVDHPNHRYYTEGISSHNTNVGKSFFMTDFASHCLANQKNVLYITLEMSEEELARRIDANLLNININELDEVPLSLLQKKMEEKSRNIKSRLIFKEFPTGRGSAADFNKLLDELELKKGFKPDILFVDYINICASSTLPMKYKADKYLYIKTVAEELRGLAVEKDIPIFTATQTNREGYGDSDPDLTNTSESWGLPATADFMFAMMTDDQLEQLSQFRIKQLKNRYNRKDCNKRFCIGYDLMKMRLFDIDDSVGSVSTEEEQEEKTQNVRFSTKKKTLDFSGISV